MTTENENNGDNAAFERLRARLHAQQEQLRQHAAAQRRQAEHSDYLYDKSQDAYWDRIDGRMYVDRAVDASIPQERWRAVVEEAAAEEEAMEGGPTPARRGRPRARQRTRLVKPSEDIRRVENNLFVESSTWWPGQPQLIADWFVDGNGPRKHPGARLFNTYCPPLDTGDARIEEGEIWAQHVRRLFPQPTEHEHFFDICAHMVQRPHEKCNTAVVMSGTQGIGKDAALLPVRLAVGVWNSRNIDPDDLFSPYRPWLETLMLTIDEVRPTGEEFKATNFYNVLKPLIAAPPDTLPLNDKYMKLRYCINLLRVFITTNDWLALFIPENDRRMFIMNSPLPANWHTEAPEGEAYFAEYWRWLSNGGAAGVAKWLAARNIEHFDPKAPPPKTQAWHEISVSWDDSEHDPIHMALDEIGWPNAIITSELLSLNCESVSFDYRSKLESIVRSPRKLAHRMHEAGYAMVPPTGKMWEFESGGKRLRSRTAFVKRALAMSGTAAIEAVRQRGRALVSGAF